MSRALIIVHNGFTDSEFTYALDRCREEDITVHVATLDGADAFGEKGWRAKAQLSTESASLFMNSESMRKFSKLENFADFFGLWDILILPGGVKSIEKVRQDIFTIEIIKKHHAAGKVIGSMCHSGQLLIEAGLAKGRLISGYYSIKTDIVNAGGTYADFVAVCDNIVSAPHYDFNGKWMGKVIELWKARQEK